ncbi:hypothetical protein QR680_006623 [Steinernema hermaphroditum]|uniref:Tyrosine-protein phosphatase domain-containing protein n=1 Tax=Steinernema hermaphroditum TaxID=289476 RepID=A0AA39HYD7_9BILA|nr:hypothetical protein QR680_006623 [Steinernema hermaphroditum]
MSKNSEKCDGTDSVRHETKSEGGHKKHTPRPGRPLGNKKISRSDAQLNTDRKLDVTAEDSEKKVSIQGRGPKEQRRGKNKVTPAVEAACAEFVANATSQGVEGFRKDFAELKAYVPLNFDHNAFMENEQRNRYRDVVCLDTTRVTLTLNVPPETNYVHANWVKMPNVDKAFIAAQGPLDSTISDFWRMVHQEGVTTILMLCKTEENGKQGWFHNKKVEKREGVITSMLEVLPEGCSNSIVTKLIQMVDWPDRGVPKSGMSVLRLIKLIAPGGHCLVHCSAGIGRTGTIIAVETAIQRLWKGQRVSMKDIVIQLRNQRASSVQTEGQYCFAHICVLYYINAKMSTHREAVLALHQQYTSASLN